MMTEATTRPDHDELELMLPWYVNGTLDVDELALIERHLQSCAECRDSVGVLSRMEDAVTAGSLSPIVPTPDVGKLFDMIDARERAAATNPLFSPVAIAAAVAIVLFGAAMIVGNLSNEPGEPKLFETATSSNAAGEIVYVLAVQFAPTLSREEQQRFVEEIGGTNIGAGEVPGSLQVSIPAPGQSIEDLNNYTKEIEARDEIDTVQVIAVQLPVR